jgi:hypothetical protein
MASLLCTFSAKDICVYTCGEQLLESLPQESGTTDLPKWHAFLCLIFFFLFSLELLVASLPTSRSFQIAKGEKSDETA